MTNAIASSPSGIAWEALRSYLFARWRRRQPRQHVEDAIQDTLLLLLQQGAQRAVVANLRAFANRIVQRRLVDATRREHRRVVAHATWLLAQQPATTTTAWVDDLIALGHRPTAGWTRLLVAIERGTRTTRGLARVLDRDPKTVKESRGRLQAWLRAVGDRDAGGARARSRAQKRMPAPKKKPSTSTSASKSRSLARPAASSTT
jgi:hypothetical protein